MRRLGLNISVSVAAVALGAVALLRGERALAVCFVMLGLLRAVAILSARRPRKIEPGIKLGLSDSGKGKS